MSAARRGRSSGDSRAQKAKAAKRATKRDSTGWNRADGADRSEADDSELKRKDGLAPGGTVDPERVRRAKTVQRGGAESGAERGEAGRLAAADDDAGEVSDDGGLVVRFKLTRDLRKRLDRYLVDRIPFMSRSQLQRLIHEEAVTVNGRVPKAATALRIGDEISVLVPPPPSREIVAEAIPLRVIHEDADIIVINKQPSLIVHPARSHKTGTLVNALAYHFAHRSSGALSSVGEAEARPGVVHRLDRDTTGVMVAAKTDTAHWRLGKQFSARTVDKRYLAVVHGAVEPVVDEINLPVGKHPTIRELQAIRFDDAGRQAKTIYRLREQFRDFALVELELKTGRTHQIRVHLSYLGWPIVGDDVYGGRFVTEEELMSAAMIPNPATLTTRELAPQNLDDGGDWVIKRQALHATTLGFVHPTVLRPVKFVAPLWDDMRRLVRLLQTHRRIKGPVSPPGAMVKVEEVM